MTRPKEPSMHRLFLILLLFVPGLRVSWAAQVVDDCNGDNLGCRWASFTDPRSWISPTPFSFSPGGHGKDLCARLEYEFRAGDQYQYAGMVCNFTPQDVSAYEGVRFWAKGQGLWNCQLPIPATATAYNHYSSPVIATEAWQPYELPFSKFTQLWGPQQPWDPTAVTGVQFEANGSPGNKGWICVADLEFYKKEEAHARQAGNNPVLPDPKVNQDGYLPGGEKYFVVSQIPGVQKGSPFKIIDASGKTAFSGEIQNEATDETASTGEKVYRVDFSSFHLPGRYTVSVNGHPSVPFSISARVYQPLFKDALRCFYLIRCGTAIDDKVTGIQHAPCHMKDAPFDTDRGKSDDFTGGWHNAGDYGKWTHMEAISCAWMMWLYELKPKEMAGLNNQIPESGNGLSDLLNEAHWGLNWLLKMQAPDGGVYHKVDSEDHFCFGTVPEKDPYPRYLQGKGSIDAGVFTGVMCQAARVYKDLDPAFSEKCRLAAQKSWAWLQKNPNVLFHDPDYGDNDASQAQLWALGEMARMSGEKDLEDRFIREGTPDKLQAVTWPAPQFFGYMAQALGPETPDAEKDGIVQALTRICDNLARNSDSNGYGVCLEPQEYHWESNEDLLHKTGALLFADNLTGDHRYRTAALRQLHYLLGLNSLETSFVTGHGQKAESHPHHWDYPSFQIVMPGWAGGGPNQYLNGADPVLIGIIQAGTPPAKCFFDGPGTTSWASNEGETTENAALVFDAGYLAWP